MTERVSLTVNFVVFFSYVIITENHSMNETWQCRCFTTYRLFCLNPFSRMSIQDAGKII